MATSFAHIVRRLDMEPIGGQITITVMFVVPSLGKSATGKGNADLRTGVST